MYRSNKKDLVEIIKKRCEMKGVQLIEGKVCVDHIHLDIAILPKMSVLEFMSYLKGKSVLMFFERHPESRTKWEDRHLWTRDSRECERRNNPKLYSGTRGKQ